jgi:hypothetical protein
VNKLTKQAKGQPPQDNHRNMVKRLRSELPHQRLPPNIKNKQIHHKKKEKNSMDENVEYARSAYLNARRPHIKSGIGYKTGDKHNSRVNINGQQFIKFTKANTHQEKKQNTKNANNASYAYTNASHVSHMSYHDFDASYVLMRNKLGNVIGLHVGPHHNRKKTCVWVPKCLVTNFRGHN